MRNHVLFRQRFMGGDQFLENFNNTNLPTSQVGSLLESSFEKNSTDDSYYTNQKSDKRTEFESDASKSLNESKDSDWEDLDPFDQLD